jgi:hypothetical protein
MMYDWRGISERPPRSASNFSYLRAQSQENECGEQNAFNLAPRRQLPPTLIVLIGDIDFNQQLARCDEFNLFLRTLCAELNYQIILRERIMVQILFIETLFQFLNVAEIVI